MVLDDAHKGMTNELYEFAQKIFRGSEFLTDIPIESFAAILREEFDDSSNTN